MCCFYFLASPYNGSDKEKEYRLSLSKKVASEFLANGLSLFAPIVYNQALISAFSKVDLEKRRQLLMPMNLSFLYKAAGLILLKIEGWDSSWGIRHYLGICRAKKIAVYDLEVNDLEANLLYLIKQIGDFSL